MKYILKSAWENKRVKVLILVALGCTIVYLILRFLLLGFDPVMPLISSILDHYLLWIEKLSNLFSYLAGEEVKFKNHIVVLNDIKLDGFYPLVIYRKTLLISLLIIWLTNANIGKKILISFSIIFVSFLFNAIYLAAGAHLTLLTNPDYTILGIPYIVGIVLIITILFVWYKVNKESILTGFEKIKANRILLNKIIISLFILGYTFFFLFQFLFNYFDFYYWINLLLLSAQKILGLAGFNATVEPYYLTGSLGSVFVNKDCLGLRTMFLFASLIYLTRKKNLSCWIYIISGILFLNFINALRLVFLFIQIQKQGVNVNMADINVIHNIYNYVIYAIVFILWIIWFERFADVRLRKRPLKKVG